MAEEEGQIFPGGEITVATAELNPVMVHIQAANCWLTPKHGCTLKAEYFVKDDTIRIPILGLPIPYYPYSSLYVTIRNDGDEIIDVKAVITVDGSDNPLQTYFILEGEPSTPAPTARIGVGHYRTMFSTSGISRAIGKHTIGWKIWAKRPTDATFPTEPQTIGNSIYYVYTGALDAIASTVKIVQGAVEHLWLTGTAEGFATQPVVISPNEPTYFKFELTNPGDEPVRMNVGHLVDTIYETGFLVGGILMDTIEKDVLVNAGATAVINTEVFTPLAAGSLTIGSFAVLRTRHLI